MGREWVMASQFLWTSKSVDLLRWEIKRMITNTCGKTWKACKSAVSRQVRVQPQSQARRREEKVGGLGWPGNEAYWSEPECVPTHGVTRKARWKQVHSYNKGWSLAISAALGLVTSYTKETGVVYMFTLYTTKKSHGKIFPSYTVTIVVWSWCSQEI